jgi:hypothetical protein
VDDGAKAGSGDDEAGGNAAPGAAREGETPAEEAGPRRKRTRAGVTGERLVQSGRVLAVFAAILLAVALSLLLREVAPGLNRAQRATAETFATLEDRDDLRDGVRWDCAFAAAYVVFGLLLFSLFASEDDGRRRAGAAAGSALLLGGGIADLVENGLLYASLDERRLLGFTQGAQLDAMRAAGMVKWGLLSAAVMALLILVATRERGGHGPGSPSDPAQMKGQPSPWDPPEPDENGKLPVRLGVCLSGGGIRSAAYSLGGLQALQDRGVMSKVEYLAAVSGGGYLAAGWAIADAQQAPGTTPPVWSQGSPEERWFRNHSSYLVPDLLGGLKGVGRLVGGVLVNFVVIWLLLFLIARPAGWVIALAHDELAAVEPVALARDRTGDMAVGTVSPAGTAVAVVDGATVPAERYQVPLKTVPETGGQVCFDISPFDPGEKGDCFTVVPGRPGVVEVRSGKAHVLVQPTVVLEKECTATSSTRCRVRERLEVSRQPRLALKEDAVHGPLVDDQVKVSRQAQVRSTSGMVDRPDPRYPPWMWQGSIGLLAAGGLAALWVVGGRLSKGAHTFGRNLALALALAGAAWLLLTIVLPALAVWLPELAGRLPGTNLEVGDALVPSGGLAALSITAAHQYLTGNRKGSGTGPATSEKKSGSLFGRVQDRLTRHKGELSWYETSPTKILLFVALAAGMLVSFVAQLQYPIANGIGGDLMGLSFIRDRLADAFFVPEWLRFVLVAALMTGFACAVDAHSWSLYPFYKRSLSSAYILRRDGGVAEPISYDKLLPFSPDGTWKGLRGARDQPPRPGPKLVLCCAVNLSQYGKVPPGRRAASFTFGSDLIGGPLVGYVPAKEYWAKLPENRRRDITIPSAMAISGAAFSPAMGKKNLGPVGSVLALSNLRLGVWLPHPGLVKKKEASWWNGPRRPGWTWFVREVLNSYRDDLRYVYVSDGGHWDNLGLVELLRRNCTEIICISAAGDGALSFGTIGEAIALAREELQVEIKLDPSPLRPPAKAPEAPAGKPGEPGPAKRAARELRRKGATDKVAPFALKSSAISTYTWTSPKASGKILYIETALTADMQFDVHAFAESETIFPDDATGDQVFNHRQFESFRALGYHQVWSAFT